MFCEKCGKELKDDALFCPKCGQRTDVLEPENDVLWNQFGQRIAESATDLNMSVLNGVSLESEDVGQRNLGLEGVSAEVSQNIEASKNIPLTKIPRQPSSGNGRKWGIIGGVAAGVIAIAAVVITLVVNKGLLFGSLSANSESENEAQLYAEDGTNSDELEGNSGKEGENGGAGDDADGNAEPTIAISCKEVIYNEGLPNVSLALKSGHDNPEGDVIYEATTQENGIAEMPFSTGEYTLCWEVDGYYGGCENITIGDGGIYLVKHLVPYQTEQKAYILVEWNSDKDLDLCVYNAQTKQYINIFYPTDDAGDFLYGDNTGAQGYELIYLKDYTDGIYTIYVRDNASLLAGTTSNMAADDLKVSIYTADGLIYQETAVENQTAALWSPAYLYQGQTYVLADYIYDLNEYAWATWDKSDAEFVENLAQTQTTQVAENISTDGNQLQSNQQTQSQSVQQSSNNEDANVSDADSEEKEAIEWTDDVLEAKMREIIGIYDREIYLSDIVGITSLDLSADGSSRRITDISNLSGMTNLLYLDLSGNYIADFSVLYEMTKLEYLDLSRNINSVNLLYLRNMTNLKHLAIGGNAPIDFNEIKHLTNLEYIDASNTNLSPDTTGLSQLTNLKYLNLSSSFIDNSDLDEISGLQNLETLNISGDTRIDDISALSGLINLKSLDLGRNGNISDITALSNMTKLEELNLQDNRVCDISPLRNMTNMKYLNLGGNRNLRDISALSSMTHMEQLYLNDNNITDISALRGMTSLTELNLTMNDVVDISPLSGLTSLNRLVLQQNKIVDVSPLSGLTNISYLILLGNNIRDVSSLSGLTNLETLDLNDNNISDYSPVSFVPNLGRDYN